MFSRRPQRGGQRIIGAEGALEIARHERRALGLHHDHIGTAFDVDGAAMRLVRAFVGHDGIRFRALLRRLPGGLDPPFGLGDLRLELPRSVFHRAALLIIRRARVELLPRLFLLGQLAAQLARMIFEVAQFQSRVGQLRLGRFVRRFQLADPPLGVLARLLEIDFLIGHFDASRLGRVKPGVPRDDDQQQDQHAHRANQNGQERKQGEPRLVLTPGLASCRRVAFHAA